MITTTVRNVTICEAIAEKIISELINQTQHLHRDEVIKTHKYHEDIIFEREVGDEDGTEQCYFEDIFRWGIVDSEVQDVFESLQYYSQDYIKDYVRDVYPDWRHSMD